MKPLPLWLQIAWITSLVVATFCEEDTVSKSRTIFLQQRLCPPLNRLLML